MDYLDDSAIIVLFSLIVLFGVMTLVGFKTLFYPIVIAKRLASNSMQDFNSGVKFLVVLWTVVLCPGPFIYLAQWIIDLARSILINGSVFQGKISLYVDRDCSEINKYCLDDMFGDFGVFWNNSILSSIQSFSLPNDLDRAGFIFAIGVTAAFFFRESRLQWIGQFSGRVSVGTAATLAGLALSFAIAIYLAIIAIIAVPVFGQRIPDIAPLSDQLQEKLLELAKNAKASPVDLDAMMAERNKLPKSIETIQESEDHLPTAGFSSNILASNIWNFQLDRWDKVQHKLAEGLRETVSETANFQREAVFFFMISNEGRVGETASQRHATRIVDAFGYWQDRYNDNVRECAAILQSGLDRLQKLKPMLEQLSQSSNPQVLPFPAMENDGPLSEIQCSEITPSTREFLPQRTGPADSLGPFGVAAAWLLRTENQELALITGLLGFGFFGALAASFIREYKVTPGTEMPKLGFIIPAFIRGISAAVLIFLLTKGGTAVLTKGDVSLNAYAIFFACFVAAVFSEDVWTWARRRQSETLPARSPDEASPTPPAGGEAK